jgi:hypothetical protein
VPLVSCSTRHTSAKTAPFTNHRPYRRPDRPAFWLLLRARGQLKQQRRPRCWWGDNAAAIFSLSAVVQRRRQISFREGASAAGSHRDARPMQSQASCDPCGASASRSSRRSPRPIRSVEFVPDRKCRLGRSGLPHGLAGGAASRRQPAMGQSVPGLRCSCCVVGLRDRQP